MNHITILAFSAGIIFASLSRPIWLSFLELVSDPIAKRKAEKAWAKQRALSIETQNKILARIARRQGGIEILPAGHIEWDLTKQANGTFCACMLLNGRFVSCPIPSMGNDDDERLAHAQSVGEKILRNFIEIQQVKTQLSA